MNCAGCGEQWPCSVESNRGAYLADIAATHRPAGDIPAGFLDSTVSLDVCAARAIAAGAVEINKRHGGPYDRGSADAYYGRPFNPHYFTGTTWFSPEVKTEQMTEAEIAEYRAGYDGETDRKVWD